MFKQLVCILLLLNIAMAAKVNRHNSVDKENHEAAPADKPAGADKPAAGADKPAAGADKPAAGGDKPAAGGKTEPAKPAEPSKEETLLKDKCKPELDACKQACVDTLKACKPQAQRSGIAGYNLCIANNEEAKKLIACYLKNK